MFVDVRFGCKCKSFVIFFYSSWPFGTFIPCFVQECWLLAVEYNFRCYATLASSVFEPFGGDNFSMANILDSLVVCSSANGPLFDAMTNNVASYNSYLPDKSWDDLEHFSLFGNVVACIGSHLDYYSRAVDIWWHATEAPTAVELAFAFRDLFAIGQTFVSVAVIKLEMLNTLYIPLEIKQSSKQ